MLTKRLLFFHIQLPECYLHLNVRKMLNRSCLILNTWLSSSLKLWQSYTRLTSCRNQVLTTTWSYLNKTWLTCNDLKTLWLWQNLSTNFYSLKYCWGSGDSSHGSRKTPKQNFFDSKKRPCPACNHILFFHVLYFVIKHFHTILCLHFTGVLSTLIIDGNVSDLGVWTSTLIL